ncbi:MAG: L-threonylcarbamoyladenylate synthase [Eubacteriales bacterium]|nr:L-threonylcarbamoyladenylate synthase [Eubacteriales bacterium]
MKTTVVRAQYKTKDGNELTKAAICLADGGLVAFPTETVYGLGADALNAEAAKRIYEAKGRPSDNPLIVHIAKVEDMDKIAHVNEMATVLAQAFWPGPLTIVLPKKDIVPYGTTGGLDTVAIRMPSHPVALRLIEESGVLVAAPSANTSGRPSPTKADHVVEDMTGKIDYIIDGGEVGIGIESTIVDVSGEIPTILRPGFITKKMLEDVIGPVMIDPALEKPLDGFRPKAPGMKYTHYAPKGELTLVESDADDTEAVVRQIIQLAKEKREAGFRVGIMAPEGTLSQYQGVADVVLCVGNRDEQSTVAAHLYGALRDFDTENVDYIYAESFRGDGLSYAIMNRLLKAAGQRVMKV